MNKEVYVDLPEEAANAAEGTFQGKDFFLSIQNGIGYLWAIYGTGYPGEDITLVIRNLRGSQPVACCATQWDELNTRPLITEAVILLKSVQRAEGLVRVVALNTFSRPVNVIIGVTYSV